MYKASLTRIWNLSLPHHLPLSSLSHRGQLIPPTMRFFSRLLHKSTPVIATNMALDSWCHQSHTPSARFVQKVELCTALSTGEDAWGAPVVKNHHHHHTLLRVSLAPIRSSTGPSEDTFLIERVLSTGGAYHSVTPIGETFAPGGTFFHPDVHDRICVIADGPSTTIAQNIVVERTLLFGDGKLSLAKFAQIIGFVGRMTRMICDGGDCKFQSRSFAFTCLTALTPTIPPRRAGEGKAATVKCGGEIVDDSVFELTSEAFLGQVPWLVSDSESESWQAVSQLVVDVIRQMLIPLVDWIDRCAEVRGPGKGAS